MYPPEHHQERNFDNILRTIRKFPLATLISAHNSESYITHLPLIHYEDGSAYGKLIGHLDRNNPHREVLHSSRVKAVFNGPDLYISPRYYATRQLPTWNYIRVHLEGACRVVTDTEKVKASIVEMTRILETGDDPFVLDLNDPRMDRLVGYITGFEILISGWEGKFKLSQDKTPLDIELTKEKLIEHSQSTVADYLEAIYRDHQTGKG